MPAFLAAYDFLLVSMVLAAVLALSLYVPLMAGQLSLASPGFYALGGTRVGALDRQLDDQRQRQRGSGAGASQCRLVTRDKVSQGRVQNGRSIKFLSSDCRTDSATTSHS